MAAHRLIRMAGASLAVVRLCSALSVGRGVDGGTIDVVATWLSQIGRIALPRDVS